MFHFVVYRGSRADLRAGGAGGAGGDLAADAGGARGGEGARLGNPNGAAALRRAGKGRAALRAAVMANVEAHARDLAPALADIRAGGATSLWAIAAALTARGMRTRRGGRWHVSTVAALLRWLGEGREAGEG